MLEEIDVREVGYTGGPDADPQKVSVTDASGAWAADELIRRYDSDLFLLILLSYHPNPYVRGEAGRSPELSETVWRRLARAANLNTVASIAKNPRVVLPGGGKPARYRSKTEKE